MGTTSQPAKPLRFIITGGGTGGHVFPAIAIGLALRRRVPGCDILFVGAKGRMEMEKVPGAGFHIIGLDIAGLSRRLTWKNLLLPWKIIKSIVGAKKIIKRFRPDVVIGVGGYASAPVVWAAAGQKIPVLIQEQNSFPGITNRYLGKKASKICVSYDGMEKYFNKEKLCLAGNPVREDITKTENKRTEALAHFGLDDNKPVLLITGGSLGARSINEAVSKHLAMFLKNNIQLIWQTGSGFYQQAAEQTAQIEKDKLYINAFIDRMDYAFAAADLVVSRAGAIAVSEITAAQKPAILIPSPNVAEDHQTKNAMALVNNHAAILIKDREAESQLGKTVTNLIFDEDSKHRLRERLAGLTFHDPAGAIAGEALSLTDSLDTKTNQALT